MLTPFSHWGVLIGGTMMFFILGWIWYNPITPIGRKWMELNNFEAPKPENMPKPHEFAVMLIFQLFMGFIITHTVMTIWGVLDILITPGIRDCIPRDFSGCPAIMPHPNTHGILRTFIIIKIYMGFVFIKDLGHWYFEKKPFGLILIGIGYYLTGILGVCMLLSYFL
jgi:Protein of unknown function (DUF1761)